MKIREIIDALEDFAPLALQDGFDNAGLQIGLPEDVDAAGVLLSLDVTEQVIDEAVSRGCNMVISHHPLLFHPLKSISGKTYVERCIIKAIRNGITVYASHTNLDNAPNGVNYKIAEKLNLRDLKWLEQKDNVDAGSGVVGSLDAPMRKDDFVALVKETFSVPCVRFNNWNGQFVQKVAVCGGSGAFLIPNAIKQEADAFITGEIGYHRFFGYEDDLLLMEIGHYESEQFTLDILQDVLNDVLKDEKQCRVVKSQFISNPLMYK